MSIGTLFVLPVIYTFLASDRAGVTERIAADERAIRALAQDGAQAEERPWS